MQEVSRLGEVGHAMPSAPARPPAAHGSAAPTCSAAHNACRPKLVALHPRPHDAARREALALAGKALLALLALRGAEIASAALAAVPPVQAGRPLALTLPAGEPEPCRCNKVGEQFCPPLLLVHRHAGLQTTLAGLAPSPTHHARPLLTSAPKPMPSSASAASSWSPPRGTNRPPADRCGRPGRVPGGRLPLRRLPCRRSSAVSLAPALLPAP